MQDEYDLQEYNYQIDQVKAHHRKKYEHIKLAVEALEAANYPKEKIRAKIVKDLEGFVSERYIREVCADLGLTDQRFNNDEIIRAEAMNAQANGQSTILADADPVNNEAAKSPPKNSSSEPKDTLITCPECGLDGIKDLKDHCCICKFRAGKKAYHDVNAVYIHHVLRIIKLWQQVKTKIELIPFIEKIDAAIFAEWMTVSDGALDFADQAWDERNIVPVPYQFKLAEYVNASTIKNGAKMFLGWVKEYSKISSKQVTKILSGKVREVDSYYEPSDEIEAKESGFFGPQCRDCGSRRLKWEHGWVHCYGCEAEYAVKATPLGKYKDEEEGEAEE